MRNIIEFLQADNHVLKKVANTDGGVWKGPCPWCGGKDRFSVVPEKRGGWFICNQCKESGDQITYLMGYRNMSFFEACHAAGKTPDFKSKSQITRPTVDAAPWEPRENKRPNEQWIKKAIEIQFNFFKYLMSSAGQKQLEYLNSRGLSNETIKAARIGYNPTAITLDAADFGLSDKKTVWIPQGLLIPYFDNNELIRIRVRQDNPATNDRFILLPGSSTDFMIYPNFDPARKTIVFEAELDGWLCWQYAKDIINIMAIGNSSTRPDQRAHKVLTQHQILISLDNDPAGQKEAEWWLKKYKGICYYTPQGKDLSDRLNFDLSIKKWVSDGIDLLDADKKPEKQAKKIKIELPGKKPPGKKPEKPETPEKQKKKPVKILSDDVIKTNEIEYKSKCMHENPCIHYRSGVCFLIDENIYNITECPGMLWKKHEDKPGIFSIVLLPAFYTKNKSNQNTKG